MCYGNVWESQSFSLLSQVLFDNSSNATVYAQYNLLLIAYLITIKMGLTTTIGHMFLWEYGDLKAGWYFLSLDNLKKFLRLSFWFFWKNKKSKEKQPFFFIFILQKREVPANPDIVLHYKSVVSNCYEVSNWWYANALVLSFIVYNSLVGTHHIQLSCYSIQYFLW